MKNGEEYIKPENVNPFIFEKKNLLLFLLFTALVSTVTYPVVFEPENYIIGSLDSPALGGELFLQAHTCQKFDDKDFTDFFHTDLANFPLGQDLAFQVGLPSHLLLYPALRTFLDLFGAYNILVILIMSLNGFTTYFFLKKRQISTFPAALSGIYLMLSPYFLIKLELGFISKLVYFWCPLYIDRLLVMRRTGRLGDAVFAGILLAFALTGYPQYVSYLIIITAVVFTFDLINKKHEWRHFLQYALIAALFIPAAFLFFRTTQISRFPGLWPNDLAQFPYVEIFRFWRFFPMLNAPGVSQVLPMSIPVSLILLWLTGFFCSNRDKTILIICSVIVLLISLGPFIQKDFSPVTIFGNVIPLPFYFIAKYGPAGLRIGFPLRAFPVALLCMLPVAMLPVHNLLTGKKKITVFAGAAILVSVLVIETVLTVPELYRQLVNPVVLPMYVKDLKEGKGAVLHLPLFPPVNNPEKESLDGRIDPFDRGPDFMQGGRNGNLPSGSPHLFSLITAVTGRPQLNLLRHDPVITPWAGDLIVHGPPATDGMLKEFFNCLQAAGCNTIVVHDRLLPSSKAAGKSPVSLFAEKLKTVLTPTGEYFDDSVKIYSISPCKTEATDTCADSLRGWNRHSGSPRNPLRDSIGQE